MAKLTLTNLATLNDVNTQNENNDLIEAAIENTLSRDGTAPNYMDAVLDMNGYRIINVPTPIDPTDGVNKQYVDDEIAAIPVGSPGSGGDHGLLSGLEDDDHPQYPSVDTYENISAYWEFTGTDGILITEDPVDYTGFFWNVGAPGAVYQDAEVQADGTYCFCYYSLAMFGDGASASNCPGLYMSHYGGTQASPTDLTAGDWIGEWTFATLQADGVGEAVSYRINAVYEAEGVSNNLAAVSLYFKSIHEDESGSLKTRVRFDADGGIVTYGASSVEATGGSQGVGTINCKGIYVDGVAVSGGGGSVATLGDIGDVTISAVADGELIQRSGSLWINRTLAEAGVAAASHTHAASAITSGTMATARLGSGTANSSTFLRGDSTWAAPTFTPTFSGVRVYRSSALVCTNNSYTAVPWSTEVYDSDSYWSGGSNITVPDTGYYHIDAGIRWDTATSGQRAIRITANSINVAEATVTPTGSINTHVAVSCDVYLTAGQVITIYAGLYNGSGDRSLNISGQTTFCNVHKIA